MIDPLQFKRSYDENIKYRCVERRLIKLDEARAATRDRYFAAAGISPAAFDRYWKKRTRELVKDSEQSAISRNFSYWFDAASPPFPQGRFNTDAFPALYTAKDVATAKAERFHYVDPRWKFQYVVYSVRVTAVAADLRPLVNSGSLVIGEDHMPCRMIAEGVRSRTDGIVWGSVRYRAGSCCAFFNSDCVRPGAIEDEGAVPGVTDSN